MAPIVVVRRYLWCGRDGHRYDSGLCPGRECLPPVHRARFPAPYLVPGADASVLSALSYSVCPLFAVIIEVVGWKKKDPKFDKLAYEFTSLLSVAYATTAALGGLLAFALFTLYPTFMGYMAGIFKDVMFMYALLFFGETFALYLYYYGWNWLKSDKPFAPKLQMAVQGCWD